MKFEISLIVYLLTIALLQTVLEEAGPWRRRQTLMSWGFGVSAVVEISLIAMQSARGVPSHMNYTTMWNGIIFGAMGVFIAFNTVLLAVLLLLFVTKRIPRPRAEIWGIRLGLAMILAGSAEGVALVMHGAHTVGARDGGAGLPFLNWSTTHGDLRVAHFFALHALQLLWAAGGLLGRTRISPRLATAALCAFAALYAGAVWLLFAQAMAGHALVALR